MRTHGRAKWRFEQIGAISRRTGKSSQGSTWQLVIRYCDTVCIGKRGSATERIVLTAFLRRRICKRPLNEITPADFAQYRDDRLKQVKAATLKRQLALMRNLFSGARDESGLPINKNPAAKVGLTRRTSAESGG
jgi:hypothetical protein